MHECRGDLKYSHLCGFSVEGMTMLCRMAIQPLNRIESRHAHLDHCHHGIAAVIDILPNVEFCPQACPTSLSLLPLGLAHRVHSMGVTVNPHCQGGFDLGTVPHAILETGNIDQFSIRSQDRFRFADHVQRTAHRTQARLHVREIEVGRIRHRGQPVFQRGKSDVCHFLGFFIRDWAAPWWKRARKVVTFRSNDATISLGPRRYPRLVGTLPILPGLG